MNKSDFFYGNGSNFYGIFREIPMNGMNHAVPPIPKPSYTIEEQDTDLPSAHKIYMDSMNEYEAAKKLVPTWGFWKEMIRTSAKVRKLIEAWREEKMLKDQAAARRMLWEQAEKGNVSAQKLLYESKKEEAQRKAAQTKAVQEDQRQQEMAEATLSRIKLVK